MTPPSIPALHHALALYKAPRSVRPGPDERLPDGMLHLLRLVAGEDQALAIAQGLTGESAETIREAAGFYIQQVMFGAGGHSYRVLGVDPDASDEHIRENFRWLARWLHPDRNQDEWETVYVDRVNQAWQHLRTPERRQRYDDGLRESAMTFDDQPRTAMAVVRHAPLADPDKPALNLRWLPKAIFAGLGVSALATVVVFYMLQNAAPGDEQVAIPPAPTAVSLKPEPTAAAPAMEPSRDANDRPVDAPVVAQIPIAATPVVEAPVVPRPTVGTALAQADSDKPGAVREPSALRAPHAARHPRHDYPASGSDNPSVVASARFPDSASRVTDTAPRSLAANLSSARTPEPVAQSPSVADVPVPANGRASAEELDANRVLGHFSQAYADGNLDGMRAMFTADASSPLGGLGAILANYSRLFESSRERSLEVSDVSWFTSGGTLTIIASYQATVTNSRNRRPRRTHGDLRLDLRREDEQWRIYRLLHDERPG
jgi:hypothetical protein